MQNRTASIKGVYIDPLDWIGGGDGSPVVDPTVTPLLI